MVATAPTLAPGFYVAEGHCWRMIRNGVGHPSHCREPARWTGRYVNLKGERWEVWSCQDHLEDLADVAWALTSVSPVFFAH